MLSWHNQYSTINLRLENGLVNMLLFFRIHGNVSMLVGMPFLCFVWVIHERYNKTIVILAS